jgi:hypothetical protein
MRLLPGAEQGVYERLKIAYASATAAGYAAALGSAWREAL